MDPICQFSSLVHFLLYMNFSNTESWEYGEFDSASEDSKLDISMELDVLHPSHNEVLCNE